MRTYILNTLDKTYTIKTINLLFLLWGFTFIFGSKIGSYKLESFTIFPNLIVGLLFVPLIIIKFKSIGFYTKTFCVILLLTLAYSYIWILIYGPNFESVFDFRSLIFYIFSFLILAVTSELLGPKKFIDLVKIILWIYLFIILFFGIFEIISGYHFEGTFTNKLLHTGYSLVDYSPVFIFDNPNDYMMNLFLIIFNLGFIDKSLFHKKPILFLILLLICLIFSIYSLARIGYIVIFLASLIILTYFYTKSTIYSVRRNTKHIIWIGVIISILFLLVYQNNFFFGKPKDDINAYLYNSKIVVKYPTYYEAIDALMLPDKEKRMVNTAINNVASNTGYNSEDVRLNLLKNGVFLIQNNPILGVGPGQYQVHSKLKKVPYDIGTNSSPHNYLIEMISNYGILGWIYFLFLLFMFILTVRMHYYTKQGFWLLLGLVIYALVSFLPSAFLYQPMNWMFTSLWIIIFEMKKSQKIYF